MNQIFKIVRNNSIEIIKGRIIKVEKDSDNNEKEFVINVDENSEDSLEFINKLNIKWVNNFHADRVDVDVFIVEYNDYLFLFQYITDKTNPRICKLYYVNKYGNDKLVLQAKSIIKNPTYEEDADELKTYIPNELDKTFKYIMISYINSKN